MRTFTLFIAVAGPRIITWWVPHSSLGSEVYTGPALSPEPIPALVKASKEQLPSLQLAGSAA